MAQNSPEVVRCAIRGTYQGQGWINVIHFKKRDNSAVTASDLASLAGLLDNVSTAPESIGGLYEQCDQGLNVTGFTLTSLGSGGNVPVTRDTTVAFAGNSIGSDAQAMLAVVAKWSTGVASRRARGRTFFSGVNVTMQGSDPDYVSSAYQANFVTDWNAFVAFWLANTTWAFVVNSFIDTEPVDITTVTEILSVSINPIFAVQRRRRPRVTA